MQGMQAQRTEVVRKPAKQPDNLGAWREEGK